MIARAYKRGTNLSVRLDRKEGFEWETPTGRIWVQAVIFGDNVLDRHSVIFRGPAIRARDNSLGDIHREGRASLRDVPTEILIQAMAAIREIKMEEKDAVVGS